MFRGQPAVVGRSDQAGELGAAGVSGVVHEVEVLAGGEPHDEVAKRDTIDEVVFAADPRLFSRD